MKRARDECNPRIMLRNQYAASLWKLHAFFLFLHAIIRILRPFLIRRLRLLHWQLLSEGQGVSIPGRASAQDPAREGRFFLGRTTFSRTSGTGNPSSG